MHLSPIFQTVLALPSTGTGAAAAAVAALPLQSPPPWFFINSLVSSITSVKSFCNLSRSSLPGSVVKAAST